jgi:hypothetical protein
MTGMKRAVAPLIWIFSCLSLAAFSVGAFIHSDTGLQTVPLQTGIPALASEIKTETVFVETCTGFGSGLIFNRTINGEPKTFIWTCGHEIRGLALTKENATNALNCYILVKYGRFACTAHVVAMSKQSDPVDAALLVTETPLLGSRSVRFVTSTPQVGEGIVTLGDAQHMQAPMSFFKGYFVTRGRHLSQYKVDQYQCSVYPGCSGGGIFDLTGNCLGIVFARGEETTLFGLPARRLIEWSRANGVEWALDSSLPAPTAIPRPTFIQNFYE